MLLACASPPVVPGRWQVSDNPNAGLEIRADGTFQGEIGPAGAPRIRLNGRWEAKGNEVTLTPDPVAGQTQASVPLIGKIDGDTMTVSATVPGMGTLNLTLNRRART
jgi:hypothetical protein